MNDIIDNNDMLAAAGEWQAQQEILAEAAREDEQAEGWRMLGIERPAHWES